MKISIQIIFSSLLVLFASEFIAVAQDITNSEKYNFVMYSLSLCKDDQYANLKYTETTNVNYNEVNKDYFDVLSELPTVKYELSNNDLRRDSIEQLTKKSIWNLEESKRFLAENKTKPGVITTKSGLQYIIIKEGSGPKPTADKTVMVHYHGTFINGEVFDSSIERKRPQEMKLSYTIDGWNEGLLLMSVGSIFKFFIPSELAYKEDGMGPVGPNQCLIFDVELLEIIKEPAKISK